MGTQKKEKARRAREGDVKDGNLRVKGENFYRDAKKVKKLNMYKTGRARRNKHGDIVEAAALQSTDAPTARVDPNRRWFGNTRVIAQDALTHFREALGDKQHNLYNVLLRRNKLPMLLLEETDSATLPQVNVVETELYSSAFGKKQQRRKPRVAVLLLEELVTATEADHTQYLEKQELDSTLGLMGGLMLENEDYTPEAREAIFNKGQLKRIWNELYKVIDSSDVVVHVLDARDPLGTRCASVETYMKKECPHKHLLFVLNKCDLVPTWVAVCIPLGECCVGGLWPLAPRDLCQDGHGRESAWCVLSVTSLGKQGWFERISRRFAEIACGMLASRTGSCFNELCGGAFHPSPRSMKRDRTSSPTRHGASVCFGQLLTFPGGVGEASFQGPPDACVPRFHYQFVW